MSKSDRRRWSKWSVLGGALPGAWVGRRAARAAPPFRPRLEELERRLVPSGSATPSLLADINPGANGSAPKYMANVSGTLFFGANDGSHGYELWKSDGTSSGTALVRDINPGANGSAPRDLTNVSGTLFFGANDGSHGYELWKSDGTSSGTALVSDIQAGAAGSFSNHLTNVSGTLFFVADDGSHGFELFKSDGSSSGTQLVRDIQPGSNRSTGHSVSTANVSGTLFFSANDGSHGYELWKSDGSSSGTTLVRDINPGRAQGYPEGLTNVSGTLFFGVNDGTHGVELWKSDGSSSGTTLVRDIYPGASFSSSFPDRMTNVSGTLFFGASDGSHGRELWKSDGSSSGTVLVKDIFPGSGRSAPRDLANVSGTLFFGANDGSHGYELWTSDGTSSGTALVLDIYPGAHSSNPSSLTNVSGTLFFGANDGSHGQELWSLPSFQGHVQAAGIAHDGATGSNDFALYKDGTVWRHIPNSTQGPNSDGWIEVTAATVLALGAGTDTSNNVDVTVQFASDKSLWTHTGTDPNSGWTQLNTAAALSGKVPRSFVAGVNGIVDVVFTDNSAWQINLASVGSPTFLAGGVNFVALGSHGGASADFVAFQDSGATNGGVWEHFGSTWTSVTALDAYAISASPDTADTADLIVSNRNASGIVDHSAWGYRGTSNVLVEITSLPLASVALNAGVNDFYVLQSDGSLFEHKHTDPITTVSTLVSGVPTAVAAVLTPNADSGVVDVLFTDGSLGQVGGLTGTLTYTPLTS